MSVPETLDLLRAVQITDDVIRALETELEEFPGKLAALREDREKVAQKEKAAESELESVKKRRRDVERDISVADQAVIKFETDKARVKTNEEFWALNNQIALERKKKSDYEDRVLLLFDEEEGAAQRVRKLKEELAALVRSVDERETEIAARAAEDRERLAAQNAGRGRLIAGMDEKLLARYDAIRARKGGSAVVVVLRGACGGCHTQQPPQRVNEIRKLEAVHTCDFCGRFLLWDPEESPAA